MGTITPRKLFVRSRWYSSSFTDEVGGGGVGVVNGALEDVLVNAGGVVVGLDLAAQVVGVEREAAQVLLHLRHRLLGLQHLRALVDQLPAPPLSVSRAADGDDCVDSARRAYNREGAAEGGAVGLDVLATWPMAATIPASASLSVGRSPSNPASSSSCPRPATVLPRTFFLGFSKFPAAVAKPSLGVASIPSRRYLRIHCQQKEQQQRLAVVPREQRWMFEESEINGPVLSLSLSYDPYSDSSNFS
ncbi:hypothetical protein BHE74_00032766 [Ensete ventricosum]|nr:hypothetical protein GW17_00008298 [Ensete ventricosum]RWW60247.1 hypothetical protein BHE74_00032766 [Ensete ventricosum]